MSDRERPTSLAILRDPKVHAHPSGVCTENSVGRSTVPLPEAPLALDPRVSTWAFFFLLEVKGQELLH